MAEFQSLTRLPMPKVGQTLTQKHPWGVSVQVERTWNDSKDLAAQATGFRWWIVKDGGQVIDHGEFCAIGGLSGSYQSCYYPAIRRIESKLFFNGRTMLRAKDSWDFRNVGLSADGKFILSFESERYNPSLTWLEIPIQLPRGRKFEQQSYGGLSANVSQVFLDKLIQMSLSTEGV